MLPHPMIFLERKNSWLLQYQLSVFLCCFAPQHIRHTGSYGAAKIRHIIPGDAYFLCITFEYAGYNLHVFYTLHCQRSLKLTIQSSRHAVCYGIRLLYFPVRFIRSRIVGKQFSDIRYAHFCKQFFCLFTNSF